MDLIQLTAVSKNGTNYSSPTTIAVNVDDIAEPISNNGVTSRVVVRSIKGVDAQARQLAKDVYEVSESLTVIRDSSDHLFLCDVVSRENRAVSYQRVFVADHVSGTFVPFGSNTFFYYAEDGTATLINYVVTQTIANIVAQTAIFIPNAWLLGGNTVTSNQKFGTISNYDVIFISNNVIRGTLLRTGQFGFGTTSPLTVGHFNSGAAKTTAIVTIENSTGKYQEFIGSGTPETFVTGNKGDWYTDISTGDKYTKTTNAANTGWTRLDTVATDDWNLNGNALSGGEKFGSTNGQPVDFYTNNVFRGRISAAGLWGFNTNAPGALVDIVSLTSNPANYVFRVQAQAGVIPNAFVVSDESEVTINSYSINNPVAGTPNSIFQTHQGGYYLQHNVNLVSFTDTTITGFLGAIAGGEFISGTFSAHSWVLRTNNADRIVVRSSGETVIGTNAAFPAQLVVYNSSGSTYIQRWTSSGGTVRTSITDGGSFRHLTTSDPTLVGGIQFTALAKSFLCTPDSTEYLIIGRYGNPGSGYPFAVIVGAESTASFGDCGVMLQTASGGSTKNTLMAWKGGQVTIEGTTGVPTSPVSMFDVINNNASQNVGKFNTSSNIQAMVIRDDTRVIIGNAALNANNPALQISGPGAVWQEGAAYGYALNDAIYGFWNFYSAGTGGSASLNILHGGVGMHTIFSDAGVAVSRAGTGVVAPLTALDVQGSLSAAQISQVANYNVGQDDFTIWADANGINITLPDAALFPRRIIVVKNRVASPSSINVLSAGGLVEGAASDTVQNTGVQLNSKAYQSDGTNWNRVW